MEDKNIEKNQAEIKGTDINESTSSDFSSKDYNELEEIKKQIKTAKKSINNLNQDIEDARNESKKGIKEVKKWILGFIVAVTLSVILFFANQFCNNKTYDRHLDNVYDLKIKYREEIDNLNKRLDKRGSNVNCSKVDFLK